MLDLVVNIDQGCSKCLVYKNRESTLSGQLKIKTSDKLKLRQLAIRLISTELVDINDDIVNKASAKVAASSSDSLHPYLQKTSKAICTWAVLPKNGITHVLEPGNHQYAIEMPLPKGLDGSIETKAYALRYELETRLEYSFILKPDTTMSTPLELDQVPMARDLYSDDRISLKVPALQYMPFEGQQLRPENVPLGQAMCLKKDTISLRNPFVFAHLWDNCLGLQLRFPRGRAFSIASQPLISFEALPINKEYKVTKVVAHIEEITIIARPQKAETSANAGKQKPQLISVDAGPSATNPYGAEAQQNLLEPGALGLAHTAASSQDSLEPNSSHNALAYAREWSSEYTNAITKVRDLGRDTQYSRFGPIELPKSHGMFSGTLRMRMPDIASSKAAHPDMRNSHVQIHHQLVYVVQYHRVKPSANDNDIVEGNTTVESMNTQRIKAVARLYGKLDQANIVRREELKPNEPPLVPPLTHEYWVKPRTVRGTLPISVVSGKIGELWGIRDVTEDVSGFGQEPDAAALDMPLPESHRMPGTPTASPTIRSTSSSITMPMPSLSRKGQQQSMNSTSGIVGSSNPHSSLHPPQPQMPTIGSGFAPNASVMYPPALAAPMGFNPMLLSAHAPYHPPLPAYPPTTMEFGSMEPVMSPSFAPPPIPQMPPMSSMPPSQQQQQYPYGGMAETAPYNNSMFQQQILQFQEQQRQQQQQFFEQLSQQYSQMAVPQSQQQQQQQQSYGAHSVSQWGGSPYPPPAAPSPGTASATPQTSAGIEQSTTAPVTDPALHAASEQPAPSSAVLDRQNTEASEDIMLATVERLEQMSMSQQASVPEGTSAVASVTEPRTERQADEQQQANETHASAAEDMGEPSHSEDAEASSHLTQAESAQTTSSQSNATTQELQPGETNNRMQSISTTSTGQNTTTATSQLAATGRSSPPPNYDDLLPPEYEVPTSQPPPYNSDENLRNRRSQE
ncbi:hypothetical protein EV178_006206 [Coemansia sp. RSA 1646]|nr:hypothetical protein EV178_006206 [Coemansia sp. RSA 1646]KAJ1766420.1 hypothetical protein LPJ74_005894 [Coemansia sp. RSA 1843]KAJ2085941.1 hypothetical protein IW138_006014 [Coemansia sp. RSA 986]KAJ2210576.1 hypothetical protein EV179_006140 [Coemansia sp. RSA 487]